MSRAFRLDTLMERSGVRFGTSGARGLVTDMTDEVCYAITSAFLKYIPAHPEGDTRVGVAGDLRSSTGRIMSSVCAAIQDASLTTVNCGRIPSPAVALYGLQQGIPAIMVTGSHIPDDRNGIKYNTSCGEILKRDESGINQQVVELPDRFDSDGMLKEPVPPGDVDDAARAAYVRRYLDCFPSDHLAGMKLGLYQHSAVGRDILFEIYSALGAEVVKLGRSETFLPVDTEAIRNEDIELASGWAKEHGLDAVVSTDGDSDRPLLSDETGKFLRGDVAGILCAQFLGADEVVTPVSCNTAAERSGIFSRVRRTRIGSPYVIEGMQQAVASGAQRVVGYEANGGFLTSSAIDVGTGTLSPLPTRDAVLVHLGILSLARKRGVAVSRLLSDLPKRVTFSDRLKDFPQVKSQLRIAQLISGGAEALEKAFPAFGSVASIDTTDGLRVTFESEDILHLRPSGNAPELRCYTEAASESRASEMNAMGIEIISTWR